jgi:hypothetical protein
MITHSKVHITVEMAWEVKSQNYVTKYIFTLLLVYSRRSLWWISYVVASPGT